MRHLPLLLLALAVTPSLAAQTTYRQEGGRWLRQDGDRTFVVDPSVITLRTSMDPAAVRAALGSREVTRGSRWVRSNRLGYHDVEIPAGRDVLAFVATLRGLGLFELVEENTIGSYGGGIPNDTSFGLLWNLHNTGQSGGTAGADVDALGAWDYQDGDPSIVVAVIDSGVEWFHRDLATNIWRNVDEVLDGTDSDGNGFVDDIRGWDFSSNDNDPLGAFFHGTAVSSVVAAAGQNNNGIVGLAGGGSDGTGVKVMCLNVGSFSPDGNVLDDAILYAAENGARVITLSLSVGQSSAIDDAVTLAHDTYGCFIDCASGNNGSSVNYPASLSRIMAVASTNDNDAVSFFSNPGPQVEVAAPGEDVYMCNLGNGYLFNSGTSFAAPHVAALAGLILSERPALTNAQVRQLIIDTADDVDVPGVDVDSGAGRINARRALAALNGGGPSGGNQVPSPGGSVSVTVVVPPVPRLGSTVTLEAHGLAAGAPAFLALGAAVVEDARCGAAVEPASARLLPALAGADGVARLELALPRDPALEGQVRYAQWIVRQGERWLATPASPMTAVR